VAVVTQDDVLMQKGFGSTAAKKGQAVDEHTLFSIASTTKAMVVTGILMLVYEGKLSLDDPIIKYIPELHFADPSLTQQLIVRDLLAHRTGLPSTDYWSFFQDMPLDEQITRLQNVQPAAPVRTRLIYQKNHVRDCRSVDRATQRPAVASLSDRAFVAAHRHAGDLWITGRDRC